MSGVSDISDPRKATEISFFAVDGFADGVSVIETKNKEYPLGQNPLCRRDRTPLRETQKPP